jgi:hypothetical protein
MPSRKVRSVGGVTGGMVFPVTAKAQKPHLRFVPKNQDEHLLSPKKSALVGGAATGRKILGAGNRGERKPFGMNNAAILLPATISV